MVSPSTSPTAGQILYDIAVELSKKFTQQLPNSTFWFALSSTEIDEQGLTAMPLGKDLVSVREQLVRDRWEIATGGNRNPQSPTPEDWEQSLWEKARQEPNFQAALFGLELETALTSDQRHLPLHVLSQQQEDMVLDLRFNHVVRVVGVDPQPDPAKREQLDRALRSLAAHEVVELSRQALGFLSARVDELHTYEPVVEPHSTLETRGIKGAIESGLRSSTVLSRIKRDDIISRADERQSRVIEEFRAEIREEAESVLRNGYETARDLVAETSAISHEQVQELRTLIEATQKEVRALIDVRVAEGSLVPEGAAKTTFAAYAETDSAVDKLEVLNNALDMRLGRAKRYADIASDADASGLDKYQVALADTHRAEVAADFVRAYKSVAAWIAPREATFDTARSF